MAAELHRERRYGGGLLVVLEIGDLQLEEACEDEAALIVREIHAARDDRSAGRHNSETAQQNAAICGRPDLCAGRHLPPGGA